MPQKEINYKVCIDFTPFVKGIQSIQSALTKLVRTKHVSYGRAPNIGPGMDI